MALENKAEIEAEYTAKATAIKAVTEAQIDSTLAPVDAFVVQCREAVLVLSSREVLNERPITGAQSAVPLSSQLVDQLENGLAQIRAAIPQLQATLPE